MAKELKNITELDLSKQMKLLEVDHRITKDALKKAFQQKIRLHHTDKGGDENVAKEVTLAYRLLNACLETGRRLPRRHTSADLNHNHAGSVPPSTGPNGPTPVHRSATEATSRAGEEHSRTQPPQRRRNRRAFPHYTVEDYVDHRFTMFFDGMNDNIFSSQYYDVDISRIFGDLVEDVLPRFHRHYRGFFT